MITTTALRRLPRLLALILAVLVLAVVASFARVAAPAGSPLAPPPAAADGIGHNGKVKNDSRSERDLQICRDWSGSSSDPECKSGTDYWYLSPGKRSNSGSGSPHWSDTDAYRIPYGCTGTLSGYDVPRVGAGWHKLRGTFGGTAKVWIRC